MIEYYRVKKNNHSLVKCLVRIYHNSMNSLGVRIWDENDFNELLLQNFVIIYAKNEKNILGFIIIKVLGNEAEIINIAVDPKYQRRGIGIKLFNHIVNTYEKNLERFILEVSSSNIKALSFYKKIGFRKISFRSKYYKIIKDNSLFSKEDAQILELIKN